MLIISVLIGFGIISLLSPTATAINIDRLSPEHKCYANIRKEIKGNNISRSLGGIVGIGWDDLSNKATLPVFSQTFNNCETDSDIMFLIPDNVVVFPIKEANIEKSTEMFETFSSYKSKIGGSIEVSGGGSFDGFGASGSFSVETQKGKENMQKLSRTGFSNKLEYHAFELVANEKAGFDKTFGDRLKKVAEAVNAGNVLLARYEAESIIGDYGTHVTNKALAGAKVLIIGFAKCTDETEKTSFSLKMAEEFKADFLGVVKVGEKGTVSTSNSMSTGTKTATSETHIITKGGADIKALLENPGNKLAVDNIVGLNRRGIPIYSLIHEGVLGKNVDVKTIEIVQDLIENATQEYYRHNTIHGCTDPTKQNYFFKANVEDGTCLTYEPAKLSHHGVINVRPDPQSPSRVINVRPGRQSGMVHEIIRSIHSISPEHPFNGGVLNVRPAHQSPPRVINVRPDPQIVAERIRMIKFKSAMAVRKMMGGVIQECEYISSYSKVQSKHENGNQCDQFKHPNQITKDYSCPSKFEKKVAGSFYPTFKHRVHTVKDENCNSTECYKNYTIIDKLKVTAYWCSHFQINDANKFIESSNKFFKVHDIKHEYDREGMIFGGIFENDNVFSDNRRCEVEFQEYPFFHNLKICLAFPTEFTVKKSVVFGGMINCQDIDQACPKYQSKYLATAINGCPYYYCATVSRAASDAIFPKIKRPPYTDRDLAMSKIRHSYQHEIEKLDDDEKEDLST